MTFENIEYLVLLLVVFPALALWSHRKRQYVSVASSERMVRSSAVSRIVIWTPLLCWLLISWLLLAELADPRLSKMTSYVNVMTKNAMVSVDTSQSMGFGPHFSTMEKIRVLLHDFAERRIEKGDYLGISAYGGWSKGTRVEGHARVIQFPSRDPEVINAAIDSIQTTMFGAFTAIGDGILSSIFALIEDQARQALGVAYDRKRLEDSLWSIGTENEDVRYAEEVVRAVGRQRGRYIVLFTDGKYNTGLNPKKALWLAERLGLKVYFIAFESTGATGLTRERALIRKDELVEAVLKTGGLYRESSDIAGVNRIFREIDRIEKTELNLTKETRRKSFRKLFIYGAAMAYGIWLMCWAFWGEPI